MAINPASNDPLLKLILHLQKSLRDAKRNAVLVIPLDIVNALLQSSQKAEVASIVALVNLFDGYNKGNCSRLDAASLHCVVHVLRTARPCPSRDRGLHLFLESLRQLTNAIQNARDQSPTLAAFHKRKSVLARKTFSSLFETFSSADATLPRRWSGEFLLELVRDFSDNKLLLSTSSSDTLPQLGRIILEEEDRPLTFVAGAIIREMLDAGYGSSLFWPGDASQALVTRFPHSKSLCPEWLESFADFLRSVHSLKLAGTPERTKLIQSIEIQGLAPLLPSGTSACVVLLDPITFVTVSDQRLGFVDVPVRSISTVKVLRGSIHLQLRHDGYYIANGLSRWSSQLSFGFNDSSQAANTAAILDEMVAWPLQSRPKQVTFATDDNVDSEGKFCKTTHGGSAFLTLAEGEEGVGFENGGVGQTTLQSHRIRTTGPPRAPSYATLELPSGDQVAKQSKDAFQGHGKSQPAEAVTHVRRTPSPALDAEQPDNAKTVEQSVPDSDIGSNDVPMSHGVQDSCGLQVVEASSEGGGGHFLERQRGDYKDVDGGLPLLAQQALRLQASKHPPSSASGTPEGEPSNSTKNLLSLAAPSVTQQESANHVVETTTGAMDADQASNVPDTASSGHQTHQKGISDSQINQTIPSEHEADQDNPPPAAAAAKTLRLRRPLKPPRRMSRRAKSRKRSVDWYQDLRVEGGDKQPKEIGKAKLAPTGQTPDSIRRNAKKAKLSSPEKPSPAQALPLTTEPKAKEVIDPPKKMRAKRQVTKTLASTRHTRRAATKAKEKLADVHDSESIAYDPDDPIESSSPVIPDAQAVQADNNVVSKSPQHVAKAQIPAEGEEASAESPADFNALPQAADVTRESTPGNENGAQQLQDTVINLDGEIVDNPTTAAEDLPRVCDDENAKLEEISIGHEGPTNTKDETVYSNTMNLKSSIVPAASSAKRAEFTGPKAQGNVPAPTCDTQPQTISDLSRKVSQFISRQQAGNAQQRENGMEIEATDNADSASIAPPSNRGNITLNSKAEHNLSQLELTCHDENAVDKNKDNVNLHDSPTREDGEAKKADIVSPSSTDKINESNPETGVLESKVFVPLDETNTETRPFSPGYIASGSSPNSHSISEASTLVPGCEHNTMLPIGTNDASSLCELTKEEFLSCNPLGASSSPGASPVEDDSSPCPKRRGHQNPPAAVATQGPEQEDRNDHQMMLITKAKGTKLSEPRDVQRRKRELKDSDTEERTTFGPNKQRANERLHTVSPVRGFKTRPTSRIDAGSSKSTKAAVRSSFVGILKAGTNDPRKQGNSKSHGGKSDAGVRLPPKSSVVTSDSSPDEHEDQRSDVFSKTDIETGIHSQSVDYSSEFVSQESSQSAAADSQTAETEWQKALRDSQRNALDILLDTSHRLIRNMVDEEKAITSIVDVYKRGCSRILDRMTTAHDENLAYVEEMQGNIQTELISRCEAALKRIELADDIADPKIAGEPKKLGLDADRRSRKILRQIEDVMQECQVDEGVLPKD